MQETLSKPVKIDVGELSQKFEETSQSVEFLPINFNLPDKESLIKFIAEDLEDEFSDFTSNPGNLEVLKKSFLTKEERLELIKSENQTAYLADKIAEKLIGLKNSAGELNVRGLSTENKNLLREFLTSLYRRNTFKSNSKVA
jgi:hypothetical protein